ncbi:hypothetical protein BPTFM16_02131 [Altererythrobacter insulae]|nr:hypothetical protein BPTFM16_02131 [Altererythrobacter insulae]
MSERLLDFLVVGAPKCGTTALAEAIGAHPDVAVSVPKEPHFFDAHYDADTSDYISTVFRSGTAARIRGEATPSYLMVPWVASRVAQHYPKAKIIACLRNPTERAFSSWWMLYSRGLEKLNFEDAIAAELAQGELLTRADAPEIWRRQIDAISRGTELPVRTYLEAGYYAKHLGRWFEVFPSEQVHVIFSSELHRSRDKTLEKIWDLLAVERWSPPPSEKQKVNEAFGGSARLVLRSAQSLGLMRFRRIVPESYREPVKAILSKMGSKPSLDKIMRAKLNEHFQDQNSKLEQLLSVDLSHWK